MTNTKISTWPRSTFKGRINNRLLLLMLSSNQWTTSKTLRKLTMQAGAKCAWWRSVVRVVANSIRKNFKANTSLTSGLESRSLKVQTISSGITSEPHFVRSFIEDASFGWSPLQSWQSPCTSFLGSESSIQLLSKLKRTIDIALTF